MMAKTKNSKILAMALCASVMAGIYASPVLAGEVTNITGNNSGLTIQIDTKMRGELMGFISFVVIMMVAQYMVIWLLAVIR